MSVFQAIQSDTSTRMQKCVDSLKKDLTRIRTGRASPALFDGVMVDYYGSPMQINQVANISVPDARMIIVQPWEKTMVSAIERAIQAAGLGLNPQSDGGMLRIPIPPLSEERRKDLFKNCKKVGEESKVALRNVRRDANEELKAAEKAKTMTQDEVKKAMDEIQKLTDKFTKSIDEVLAAKEKEIMEV